MELKLDDFYFEMNNENLQKLKNKLEMLDKKLFNERNKKYYKVVKLKNRILNTKIGLINIKRYIYKYYNTFLQKWEYISLLDKALNLKRWQRKTNDLIESILKFIGDGKRYRDIIDIFSLVKISKMYISRLINNIKLKVNNVTKIKLAINDKIYINVDDSYINLRNFGQKQKYRFRTISFHTGIEYIGKRKKLKNKIITYMVSSLGTISTQDTINFIINNLEKYYEFVDINDHDIIICGDGAPWIKAVAMWMDSKYLIDKFHPLKYLYNVFIATKRPNFEKIKDYKIAKSLLIQGELENLVEFLYLKKINLSIIQYFKKNRIGIKNQKESWNIGVSAESDVFHFIKSLKGNGAKIYNYNSYINIINLNMTKFNNQLINYNL